MKSISNKCIVLGSICNPVKQKTSKVKILDISTLLYGHNHKSMFEKSTLTSNTIYHNIRNRLASNIDKYLSFYVGSFLGRAFCHTLNGRPVFWCTTYPTIPILPHHCIQCIVASIKYLFCEFPLIYINQTFYEIGFKGICS